MTPVPDMAASVSGRQFLVWPLMKAEANSGAAPVCGEYSSSVTHVPDMAA